MILIKSQKIMRNQLDTIPISHGNLIYCEDTQEVYYDYQNGVRGTISCETLANEGMRVAIPENRRKYTTLYYVLLTDKFYIMSIDSQSFIEVRYVEEITHISGEILNLYPGYLHNQVKYFAPYTTSSSILMSDSLDDEDGPFSLQDYINNGKLSLEGFGIGLRTKVKTLTIEEQTKTVFIDYPVGEYKVNGFEFLLFRNTMFVPNTEYEIKEEYLHLIDEDDYFDKDDLLTFVFIYTVISNPGKSILEIDGATIENSTVYTHKINERIIKLTKVSENGYTGEDEDIKEYRENMRINVTTDDPNTMINPTININGLGDIPLTLNNDEEFPIGYLGNIVTLFYTNEKFTVISSNVGSEYTVKELQDSEGNVNTIYRMYKNGKEIGDPIEIPKMISDGSVKYCTEKGVPLPTLDVGDPYIEMSIDAVNKIYIPVPELSIDLKKSGKGNAVSSIDSDNNKLIVKSDINYLTEDNREDFISSDVKFGDKPLKDGITKDDLGEILDLKTLKIGSMSYNGSKDVEVTSKTIANIITHRSSPTSKVYLVGLDSTGMYTHENVYTDINGDMMNQGKRVLDVATAKTLGRFYSGTTAPNGTTRLNYDGYLYATRMYNAVYNDYAELFEVDPNEVFNPGDVIVKVPGKNLYTKSSSYNDPLVVGVVSNQYGHLLGGTGDEEYDRRHFVPVGLAGRNIVKVLGPIEEGNKLMSCINGLATMAFSNCNVFGKVLRVLSYDKTENIATVEFLIMNT